MAIDGITIKAITNEIEGEIIGGRIQKIYQINNHVIILNIYNNKKNYSLLISSNPQNSRLHFTKQSYENPTTPPDFCMILRKHLQNSIIKSIHQIGMDRSIEIIVDSKDDLGFNVDKRLMIDIMGKHSNIVLTDDKYIVIEAIKRISHEMSSVRAVYPGTHFSKLEDEKLNISETEISLTNLNIPENYKLRKIFYMNFTGFGPQIGNEIAFRSGIDLNAKWGQLSIDEKNTLNNKFNNISKQIKNNNFTTHLYIENSKPVDFYPLQLQHLGDDFHIYHSISEAMDIYYKENVNDNSLNQAKNNIKKTIESLILKATSKLDNLNLDLEQSKYYDKYRIEGDLLSSVSHKIKKGQEIIEVDNYYTNEKTTIQLNPKKNAWDNIEQKYKTSKKLHRAYKILQKSIPDQENLIKYLNSINNQLDNIDSHSEIEEIKDELTNEGLIKKVKSKKKKKDKPSKPFKFITKSNNFIYVGKNNTQNEQLTLREANPNDYFFHIKDLPGSHVILKSTYEVSEDDIIIAAYLAAKYSKNSNDRYIDVDYTQKKNVYKSKGSKLGMVYYNDFNTIRVDLDANLDGFELVE